MIRTVGAVSVHCPFVCSLLRWGMDGAGWLGGTGYLFRPLLSFLCSEQVYIGVAKEVTKANAALLQRYPFPASRRTHPFPLRGNEKGQ